MGYRIGLVADHKQYLDLSLVPQEKKKFYKVLALLENQKEIIVEA